MAFCRICGAELAPNVKFCSKCGTPVAQNEQPQAPVQPTQPVAPVQPATPVQPQQTVPTSFSVPQEQFTYNGAPNMGQPVAPQAPVEPVKKEKKKKDKSGKKGGVKIAIIIVAVILGLGALGAGGYFGYEYLLKDKLNKSKPVKMVDVEVDKFVSVSVDGYDGEGVANVTIDYDRFAKAVYEALNIEPSEATDGQKQAVNKLYYAIDAKLNKKSGLSNGDQVKVTFECSEDAQEAAGINLLFKNQEITVSDLVNLVSVDPFEYLSLSFDGISGEANAIITNTATEAPFQWLAFDIDYNYNLSIGDVITISIDEDYVEIYKNDEGIVLTRTSMEYTITESDLNRYIVSATELTQTAASDLNDMAVNFINQAYVYQPVYLQNLQYVGVYFLNSRDYSSTTVKNGIYLIYTADATFYENPYGEEEEYVVENIYIPVLFRNIVARTNGTFSCDENIILAEINISLRDTDISFPGALSEERIFNYCIMNNIDSYSYELSQDLHDADYFEQENEDE